MSEDGSNSIVKSDRLTTKWRGNEQTIDLDFETPGKGKEEEKERRRRGGVIRAVKGRKAHDLEDFSEHLLKEVVLLLRGEALRVLIVRDF